MRSKIKLEGDVLGLDLGKKRTGVARISTFAGIAEPLEEVQMSDAFVQTVAALVEAHDASAVVIGVPRGLDGQDTEQSMWSREQARLLREALTVPVYQIDEAGTTKEAEQRAKPGQSVDSVAAGIMLEDFVQELIRGNVSHDNGVDDVSV